MKPSWESVNIESMFPFWLGKDWIMMTGELMNCQQIAHLCKPFIYPQDDVLPHGSPQYIKNMFPKQWILTT